MSKLDDRGFLLVTAFGTIVLIAIIIGLHTTAPPIPTGRIISVGGYKYLVLTANTQQEWERGLMNYTFSCSVPNMCVNGMLFIFPTSDSKCFWMKDTIEPLLQIWIYNGTVVNVYKATPENTISVCYDGDSVLELSSALPYNITPGSKVTVSSPSK